MPPAAIVALSYIAGFITGALVTMALIMWAVGA